MNFLVSIPKEVIDILTAADSAKMLATVDDSGVPNVVPVWSIVAVDPETIAFAEIFIKKTKENLQKNKKVAIAVFKGPAVGYQIKGTLAEFQTSGPVFEDFAKKVKENLKLDTKSVGIIKVDEVYAASPGENSKKLA